MLRTLQACTYPLSNCPAVQMDGKPLIMPHGHSMLESEPAPEEDDMVVLWELDNPDLGAVVEISTGGAKLLPSF